MAIIAEHEQPVSETHSEKTYAEDDTPENRELVKKVNEMLARAKRHRKRYDDSWHYNYDFVCGGRQWTLERPRWRFSESVNMTWATVMTEIGIQTDARPKFEFLAQEFEDEAFVDILRDINDRNWDKYKWSSVVQDGLFDCKLYHVAHAEVPWDPELEYGDGDVAFRTLDPFFCYWDPRASDVNKGRPCRYFFYTEPVPTSELKLKHPDKKEKLKADVSNFDVKGVYAADVPARSFVNFDPNEPSRLPTSYSRDGMDLYGGEPHTMLIRLWLRDDALEEVCEEKEVDVNGEKKIEKEYLLKKKYPRGRYIEMANNCILRDGEPGVEVDGEWVPYEDDKFPIVRLVNYQYPREYAGENEVTHSRGPQKIFNYVWSYILDMFKMQGNPVTIVGDAANIDEEEIVNEPSAIYKVSDINQIRREPGTPITPGSFELLGQAKSAFDQVQGLQDVSRGAEMPAADSGILFEGYVEAAQTRPRLKNRSLDDFLQDAGELMLTRILQFYTKPRVYRITNKDGYPEFIEFYIPETREVVGMDGGKRFVKVAKLKRWVTTPEGREQILMQKEVEIKGPLDVRVSSGSALPFAKAKKQQAALAFYNAEIIDDEEVLKTVDWPNYEEVLRRKAKKKAEEAAAAASSAEGAA